MKEWQRALAAIGSVLGTSLVLGVYIVLTDKYEVQIGIAKRLLYGGPPPVESWEYNIFQDAACVWPTRLFYKRAVEQRLDVDAVMALCTDVEVRKKSK